MELMHGSISKNRVFRGMGILIFEKGIIFTGVVAKVSIYEEEEKERKHHCLLKF